MSNRVQQAYQSVSTKRYEFVTQEKSGGATYTPEILADFVARKILAAANLAAMDDRPLRILDPAVGDGALLVSLLKELQNHTTAPITVYGFDTDVSALAEARSRIAAAYPQVQVQLESGNFLEYVLGQSSDDQALPLFAGRKSERFDLIIANPPYVRTQIIGATQAQQLAEAFGLTGRVDLYHAFLIGIAHMLRSTGTAGIIVSNRFMTTRGGASVRQALEQRMALRHIWDLGDTKLFEAAVLPAVIVGQGRSQNSTLPAFSSIYETHEPAIFHASDPFDALAFSGPVELRDGRTFRVQHGTLTSKKPDGVWSISSVIKDAWLAKVIHNVG